MDLRDFENFSNSWWPVVISFVISLIGAIRFYMAGTKCPKEYKFDDKIALITGASSGLGLATARELAERGGKIILTCRDAAKGELAVKNIKESAPFADIDLRILDVSLMGNIRDFVAKLSKDYDKIDVLINNAGIVFHEFERTEEKLELTFATNYLGSFLLSHLCLPLLNKSENGRIVNITSMAHYAAKMNIDNLNFCKEFMYREAYGQTKLMLVMFTKYMATLLNKKSDITINAVSPGLVRDTNHMKNSPLASSWMTRISVFPWTWLFMKTPRQGCQSIVYAAVDPTISKLNGEYISDCEVKEPAEIVKDEILLEKLYEKSCELCSIDSQKIFKDLRS